MKIIEEYHDMKTCQSKTYNHYFKDMNMAVIDIETTGLSPANSAVILVGILIKNTDHVKVIQIFAETLSDEKAVLAQTAQTLEGVDGIISFNGHSFDIPFLEKRASFHNVKIPYLKCYHLDLYRVVRRYSNLKDALPNLKQKTLETYMGYWIYREDEIHGGESVELYFNYLENPKQEYLEKILLHNKEDVLNLYRLINIVEQTDFHLALNELNLPIKTQQGVYIIDKTTVGNNSMSIHGLQPFTLDPPIVAICFEEGASSISFSFTQNGRFEITIKNVSHKGEKLENLSSEILNSLCENLLRHTLGTI